jgi:hypothetical protein
MKKELDNIKKENICWINPEKFGISSKGSYIIY